MYDPAMPQPQPQMTRQETLNVTFKDVPARDIWKPETFDFAGIKLCLLWFPGGHAQSTTPALTEQQYTTTAGSQQCAKVFLCQKQAPLIERFETFEYTVTTDHGKTGSWKSTAPQTDLRVEKMWGIWGGDSLPVADLEGAETVDIEITIRVGTNQRDTPEKRNSTILASLREVQPDVMLEAKGETRIGAHKNILSIRSPVFKAKFLEHEFKDKADSVVYLHEYSGEVVEAFVGYMYTSKLKSDRFSDELFKLADYCQVSDLLEALSKRLFRNLDSKTVCEKIKLVKYSSMNTRKKVTGKLVEWLLKQKTAKAEILKLI